MKKIGNYRWIICGLLFFATTINYLDRAVISLVKEYLDTEFTWTNSDYANITIAFQAAYAFAMIFAGRLIDWLGTKTGYAIALVSWSVAAMSHFLLRPTWDLFLQELDWALLNQAIFQLLLRLCQSGFRKRKDHLLRVSSMPVPM